MWAFPGLLSIIDFEFTSLVVRKPTGYDFIPFTIIRFGIMVQNMVYVTVREHLKRVCILLPLGMVFHKYESG